MSSDPMAQEGNLTHGAKYVKSFFLVYFYSTGSLIQYSK